MNSFRKPLSISACFAFVAMLNALPAAAAPRTCTGAANKVSAITEPSPIYINHIYNKTQADFQEVMRFHITTDKRGCVTAQLSGMARITDNQVFMQVKVDGNHLMNGHHLTGLGGEKDQAVVYVALDEGDPAFSNDEQLTDPVKAVAYNFFQELDAGDHTIVVLAAAGSGIEPNNTPSLSNLTLTLQHP